MAVVRALGALVFWIAGSLLGLVALLLCVTVILLPVGLPLLRLAGKSYAKAGRLMLPRSVAHPVKETKRSWRKKGQEAEDAVPDVSPGRLWSKGRKQVKKRTGRKGLLR